MDHRPSLQDRQPLGTGPGAGEVVMLGPDICWFRISTQNAPLGGVNIWALRDGSGWAVVDTGFADAGSAEQWDAILARLDGPITRIICTHFHPDHIGQVGNLLRRFDVPLMMTAPEWDRARRMAQGRDEAGLARYADHLRQCGLPEAMVAQIAMHGGSALTTGLPDSHVSLQAGDRLDLAGGIWTIELGAGHSPAPAILRNDAAGLHIVGDQLLMRITPHIGIEAGDAESDPLADYLRYLEVAAGTDPETLALPGHGPAFAQAGTRAAEIAAHHHERLDVLAASLDRPTLVADTVETLFGRKLKGVGFLLGLTEAHAHLHHLVRQGRATRHLDRDGRFLFSNSAH